MQSLRADGAWATPVPSSPSDGAETATSRSFAEPRDRRALHGSRLAAASACPSSPLVAFLLAVRPRAESMLRSFALTPAEADEALGSTLQILAWRWETVRDREAWLFAMLERRCWHILDVRKEADPE